MSAARADLYRLIDSAPDWSVVVMLWIARRMLDQGAKVHQRDVETPQAHVECSVDLAVKAVHELLTAGPGAVASPSGITPARGAR